MGNKLQPWSLVCNYFLSERKWQILMEETLSHWVLHCCYSIKAVHLCVIPRIYECSASTLCKILKVLSSSHVSKKRTTRFWWADVVLTPSFLICWLESESHSDRCFIEARQALEQLWLYLPSLQVNSSPVNRWWVDVQWLRCWFGPVKGGGTRWGQNDLASIKDKKKGTRKWR